MSKYFDIEKFLKYMFSYVKFVRSIEKNKVRYTEYYGDGDTKAFSAVANVYGDEDKVKKLECIGHIQKRVGSRLRKLKKMYQVLESWD